MAAARYAPGRCQRLIRLDAAALAVRRTEHERARRQARRRGEAGRADARRAEHGTVGAAQESTLLLAARLTRGKVVGADHLLEAGLSPPGLGPADTTPLPSFTAAHRAPRRR